MRVLAFLTLLIVQCSVSHAGGQRIIDAWYDALKASDREAFNLLLDDQAVIDLKQLGITQTKSEFLSSLDVWDEVIAELNLTYSWEGIDGTSASATVCYKFANNAYTNLEVFTIQDGKVTRLEQEKLMDGC